MITIRTRKEAFEMIKRIGNADHGSVLISGGAGGWKLEREGWIL